MCSQGFGGGPLSEAVGDGLSAAGVRLRSGYGATEFGGPSHIIPTHEADWKEWSWIEIDTNAALEWEKQSDGTEELIIPVGGVLVLCMRFWMLTMEA